MQSYDLTDMDTIIIFEGFGIVLISTILGAMIDSEEPGGSLPNNKSAGVLRRLLPRVPFELR